MAGKSTVIEFIGKSVLLEAKRMGMEVEVKVSIESMLYNCYTNTIKWLQAQSESVGLESRFIELHW